MTPTDKHPSYPSQPTLITDDHEVRRLARKAGVWPLLHQSRKDKRHRVVIRGQTAFLSFEDGYAAVACGDVVQLMGIVASMRKAMSLELIGVTSVPMGCPPSAAVH